MTTGNDDRSIESVNGVTAQCIQTGYPFLPRPSSFVIRQIPIPQSVHDAFERFHGGIPCQVLPLFFILC